MENIRQITGSRSVPRCGDGRSLEVRGNAASEGLSAVRPRVLVVEDEAVYGRCLLRTIQRSGGAGTLVGAIREARVRFASGAFWNALIVDVFLPDGSGLEFLKEARATGIHVPTLIITGLRDNALAQAAFALGATYLVKPVEDVYVESLVYHAFEQATLDTRTRLHRVVNRWTVRYGLSVAERDVLLLGVQGHDRAAIAAIRGTTEATIKNQIHGLFQKTGDSCLREAAMRVLQEALE